ncbi:MAG: hypothetical protein K2L34_05115, partial [Muribaculaceae bacterium]|nr:hypothetical protein [Muribaculaceae bacterium]
MQIKTLLISLLLLTSLTTYARQSIDLAGKWLFRLSDIPDSLKSEAVTQGALHLPGTLDTNKAGIPVAQS